MVCVCAQNNNHRESTHFRGTKGETWEGLDRRTWGMIERRKKKGEIN